MKKEEVILILSIILGQAKTHSYMVVYGTSGCPLPNYINCHLKVFWSRSFHRLDALPVTPLTASKHWRHNSVIAYEHEQ